MPLIPKLAETFEVYILLVDFHLSRVHIERIESLVSEGKIKQYWLTPRSQPLTTQYWFLRSRLKTFRSYDFDVLLYGDEVQIIQRYLSECVVSRRCVQVCFWPAVTYLLRHEALTKDLLSGKAVDFELSEVGKTRADVSGFILKLVEKIDNTQNKADLLKKAFRRVGSHLRRMSQRFGDMVRFFYGRVVLPGLLNGKTFLLGRYDLLTQLGSGRSDAYIFCDEIEAKAHAALLKTANVNVAQHPSYGSCRCRGLKEGRQAILFLLTGFINRMEIPEENLALYHRDIRSMIAATAAEAVHLRVHPRETGRWPSQLRDYLGAHGIDATLVDSKQPLREIVCDYVTVGSDASNGLRDARASCDYVVVVGFVAIAKKYYANPKFVFGESEGIGWIEEDGSYDPDIFVRRRHVAPKRKTVDEILSDLINHRVGAGATVRVAG